MKTLAIILLLVVALIDIPNLSWGGEPPSERGKRKPQLSAQDAIRIAEQYLEREKIDVSDKFLCSAKYDEVGPWTKGTLIGKGPLWLLHWKTYPYAGPGGVVAVVVYMDGKVGHLNGI